ncbi:MAG: hypothetical protein AAF666_18230 [Pseudomonadota bacterium]
MTDTTVIKEPLGVGALFGESFSLVFKNLGVFLPVAIIPSAISLLLGYIMSGPAALNSFLAFSDPVLAMESQAQMGSLPWFIAVIVGIVLWGFIMAAITRAAYDMKTNGSASFGSSVQTGLRFMLPVLPIVLIVGIIVYVGLILLILPGLYLMGLFFVVIPAFIIERAGFVSLGRSAALTKDYRWPMVGLAVLFLLVFFGFGLVVGGLQFVFWGLGTIGLVLSAIVTIVLNALIYSIGSTVAALSYARLREIKEGTHLSSIAEIFG